MTSLWTPFDGPSGREKKSGPSPSTSRRLATAHGACRHLSCHRTRPYRVWSWRFLCALLSLRIREGPVRFDLEFEGEKVSFAGHGLIRWADPEEGLLGVEISDLDQPCRAWAIAVITANAGLSYIPRAPLSAAPRSKKAQ